MMKYIRGGLVAAACVFGTGIMGCNPIQSVVKSPIIAQTPVPSSVAAQPPTDAEHIYKLPKEEAMAEAKKFVVGTWTGVGSISNHVYCWKWVIKADGTMEHYDAPIDADDWGHSQIRRWEIRTAKYANTGARYYEIQCKVTDDSGHVSNEAIITESGELRFELNRESGCILKRGDKFPFSK